MAISSGAVILYIGMLGPKAQFKTMAECRNKVIEIQRHHGVHIAQNLLNNLPVMYCGYSDSSKTIKKSKTKKK